MNVTNNKTGINVNTNCNCSANSMVVRRQIEQVQNGNRRNENTLLLFDPIIFDPMKERMRCDSLESFRQMRLVCKTFSRDAFQFFSNGSENQIMVLLKFKELYGKIDKSVREKYQFVVYNNLDIVLEIKTKDLPKFGKLEQQLKENGNVKITSLDIDRSLFKPKAIDYLLGRNILLKMKYNKNG